MDLFYCASLTHILSFSSNLLPSISMLVALHVIITIAISSATVTRELSLVGYQLVRNTYKLCWWLMGRSFRLPHRVPWVINVPSRVGFLNAKSTWIYSAEVETSYRKSAIPFIHNVVCPTNSISHVGWMVDFCLEGRWFKNTWFCELSLCHPNHSDIVFAVVVLCS